MPYIPLPEVAAHVPNAQTWYLDPALNVLARYRVNTLTTKLSKSCHSRAVPETGPWAMRHTKCAETCTQ